MKIIEEDLQIKHINPLLSDYFASEAERKEAVKNVEKTKKCD